MPDGAAEVTPNVAVQQNLAMGPYIFKNKNHASVMRFMYRQLAILEYNIMHTFNSTVHSTANIMHLNNSATNHIILKKKVAWPWIQMPTCRFIRTKEFNQV